MFANLQIYRFNGLASDAQASIRHMEKARFVECGPTVEKTMGWEPPRGQAYDPLIESISGGNHWFSKIRFQRRAVPGHAVKKLADEMALKIENETGRKPGKKERKGLKEDALLQLLPHAFPKDASVFVWFDHDSQRMMLGSCSASQVDECLTFLVRNFDGLVLEPLNLAESPSVAMTRWLAEGAPPGQLQLGKGCELSASDESKATVKYTRHALDMDQIKDNLRMGKFAKKLDLSLDDRIGFTLTDALQIKKISWSDKVLEEAGSDEMADAFDGDALLVTAELTLVIDELINCLGGIAPSPGAPA